MIMELNVTNDLINKARQDPNLKHILNKLINNKLIYGDFDSNTVDLAAYLFKCNYIESIDDKAFNDLISTDPIRLASSGQGLIKYAKPKNKT